MSSDVTLTAAARNSLSSMQNTQKLLSRTQARMSTGLAVASAADDAVAYFQGRALGQRAQDLLDTKDGIAAAVGTVKAAMDALESVEKILTQMKGVALGAKSEPDRLTRHRLYRQYDELRDQLDAITGDAHFNGVNLIGDPANDLSVPLSPAGSQPMAKLDIPGASVTAASLNLAPRTIDVTYASYHADPAVAAAFDTWAAGMLAGTAAGNGMATETMVIGLGDGKKLHAGGVDALYTAADGEARLDAVDNDYAMTSAMQDAAVTSLVDFITTGGGGGDSVVDVASGTTDNAFTAANYPGVTVALHEYPWESATGYLGNIDFHIETVDAAILSVRSTMAKMGTNVALLQVRDQFAQNLALVATEGAGKLLDADLNEEGANMVALQTRAQLGVQALSFGGRSDQAVLELF